ncbi:hypothetical protein NPIL_259091, partial [Nephila pilipes]
NSHEAHGTRGMAIVMAVVTAITMDTMKFRPPREDVKPGSLEVKVRASVCPVDNQL